MVQNKYGFASRKCYGIEPNNYKKIGRSWTAIYRIGNDEYHIGLFPEVFNDNMVRDIEVLKQTETCRITIWRSKTIKSAVEEIKRIKKEAGE